MTCENSGLNKQIIEHALTLLKLEKTYTFIRYVKNYVFLVSYQRRSCILRITSSTHRSMEQLYGELDFILHLSKGKLSVAPPILSNNKKYIEPITYTNSTYYAVLFEYAPGSKITSADVVLDKKNNFKILTSWAEGLAHMHMLSSTYRQMNPTFRRYAWDEKEHFKRAAEIIPSSNIHFWHHYKHTMEYIATLPITPDSYGIIHEDLTHSNLLINASTITFLDFEDASYGWYVYDIAISLFHIYVAHQRCNAAFDRKHYMNVFLSHYLAINPLSNFSTEILEKFILLRRLSSYLWCHAQRKKEYSNVACQEWCEWMITQSNQLFVSA